MTTNQMKTMWNQRAQRDAFYYVESAFWDGNLDEFFALGEQRTQLLIDPVLPELTPPANAARVLEIGCGVGRFSRALAKRCHSVVAVDVADAMIQQAQALHPTEQYANLEFHSTDGQSNAFLPDASIDFAFSYEVFQHMPSAEVILQNLRDVQRVLKPTGTALIHLRTEPTWSLNTVKTWIKGLVPQAVWTLLRFKPYTFDATWTGTTFSLQEVQELAKQSGLQILRLIEDPTHAPGTRIFVLARPIK